MSASRKHNPALDGIRGLAVTLVLIFHLFIIGNNLGSRVMRAVSAVQLSTFLGVDLFFALSGFLITGILWESLGRPGYLRNFYARRALRIWPLYYGFLAIALVFSLVLGLHTQAKLFPLIFFVENLGFFRTRAFYDLSPWLSMCHLWSIAVEEQFYLLWPLLLLLLRRRELAIAACFIGMATSFVFRASMLHAGVDTWTIYAATPSRLDSLFLGSALALGLTSPANRDRLLRLAPFALMAGLAGLGVLCVKGLLTESSAPALLFAFPLAALASTGLIASALRPASLAQRLMSNPALRFLGRYSFGIYIYHYPLRVYGTPLRKFFFLHVHSRIAANLLASSLIAGVSIVLAVVSYHAYEVHFLKLKSFFTEPMRANPPAESEFSRE